MKILKWVGIVLAVLVGVILVGALGVYLMSESKINQTYQAPNDAIAIPTDAAAIARGEHITHHISVCVDCHGQDFGGTIVFEDAAIGRVVAPNLTRGQNGLGNQLTDEDFVRAIRYGVLPDHKSVRVMPVDDYNHLDDQDLGAVIAYVRGLPNVDSDLPPHALGPLGRLLFVAGQLPIMTAERVNPAAPRAAPVAAAVTVEYGHYLANIAGCTGCHGPGLSGGKIPGAPPDYPQSANLTDAAIKAWTDAEFLQTIRTGVDPTGHQLNPVMPWKSFSGMTDEELLAIWQFVKQVPPKEFGNR